MSQTLRIGVASIVTVLAAVGTASAGRGGFGGGGGGRFGGRRGGGGVGGYHGGMGMAGFGRSPSFSMPRAMPSYNYSPRASMGVWPAYGSVRRPSMGGYSGYGNRSQFGNFGNSVGGRGQVVNRTNV